MHLESFSNIYLQASSWIRGQIPVQPLTSLHGGQFDWDATPAHKHFHWHECYGSFQCARLKVPMDWLGTSSESTKTVELAVIKVEATVPVTDSTYGGAVVLNPGGPGGSGIGQVLRGGHHVRTVLSAAPGSDNATAKNFDIIGFDPRGVNNTRPLLTCFPNHLDAAVWTIEKNAHGMMDTSDTAFDNIWAGSRAMAEGCSKRTADEGIAKHMDTAPVARDIVEIFERHGEWREKEAQRRLSNQGIDPSAAEHKDVTSRTQYSSGEEMIQYWGFSYGTILGATLSTMYPHRVKRAVLDGVADSHDYMAGGWSTNLRDTDLIFVKLAEYCYEGGPQHCALWDEDGPAVISEKIQKAFAMLKHNPISIPGNGTDGPQLLTYNDYKALIRDIVYHPIRDFPLTAQVIQESLDGQGHTLAAYKRDHQPQLGVPLSDRCKAEGPYSPACFTVDAPAVLGDATSAIACTDGLSRLGQSKEEFREYANKIMAQSQLIGASWASIMLPCTAWETRPHWRYDGNFHNQTAHPVLFVGNTFDPVTPLYNAFLMAKGFDGAGVLHQNSEGHCSYATPSMCSGRALREYFQTGKLPGHNGGLDDWKGPGAFCEPDMLPFTGYGRGVMPPLPAGETDQELWKALVGLNQAWP